MREELVIVGVDLAGSPRRPTGICVLRDGQRATTRLAYGDDEIIDVVCDIDPDLVPTDAPLSLPPGRRSIHQRTGKHFRPCDLELQKMGIRFFPITLGPMRMLTERGLVLKETLESMGQVAVECYPGGAQDQWGLPRQHKNSHGLRRGLEGLGVAGLSRAASGHELDAASAALAGYHLLLGGAVMIGGNDGMVMPHGPAP